MKRYLKTKSKNFPAALAQTKNHLLGMKIKIPPTQQIPLDQTPTPTQQIPKLPLIKQQKNKPNKYPNRSPKTPILKMKISVVITVLKSLSKRI
jgi:hypothetical protein